MYLNGGDSETVSERQESIRHKYDDADAITTHITVALAEYLDTDIESVGPLNETVDAESLARFVRSESSAMAVFRLENAIVYVNADAVVVTPSSVHVERTPIHATDADES